MAQAARRRGRLLLLTAMLVIIFVTSALPATGQAEGVPPRLHEARFVYVIDRSDVPAWVTVRTVSLVVDVGPALDVVAWSGSTPLPCAYDGERAVVTTDTDTVTVAVTAPDRPLHEMGAVHLADLRDDKRWALSLTLDDGYDNQATTAKALLHRYGYAASIAVVGSRIGVYFNGDTYATAEQLQAVVADGWHLANHSYNHLRAAEIGDADDIVNDLAATNAAIAAAVPGYQPIMFTAPFVDTDFTPVLRAYSEQLGLHLVQTRGPEHQPVQRGTFVLAEGEPNTIGRTQLLHDGSQFDQVHRWLEEQPGSRWWLSLHTHDIATECDCVETAMDHLYHTYGAGGLDEVWVAPAPVVYQYLATRERAQVHEMRRTMDRQPPAGFQLETPEPTVTPTVRVYQEGIDGYAGTRDTFIDSLDPTTNQGAVAGINVRSQDVRSGLISFDLTAIEHADAVRVQQATLALYGLTESNSQVVNCLAAHTLERPWEEHQATWEQARDGAPWGAPGAAALSDRGEAHTGLRALSQGVERWYTLDVTDAAQRWIDDADSNYGVLIRGSGDGARQVNVASSEYPEYTLRPRLALTYTVEQRHTELLPLDGSGRLVGQVLAGKSDGTIGPSGSIPITVSFYRANDATLAYRQALTTSEQGRFAINGLRTGAYDVAIENSHALRVLRQDVQIVSGLNAFSVGPLVEGDIVRDGHIGARDWIELVRAYDTRQGDGGYNAHADLNEDGVIDLLDSNILSRHYGRYGDIIEPQGAASQPPVEADALLSIVPGTIEAAVGEPFTATVMLDTGSHHIGAVDLSLLVAESLDILSVAPTDALPDLVPASDLDGADGHLRYVALNLADPVTGRIPLLELTIAARRVTRPAGVPIAFDHNPEAPIRVASEGYQVLDHTTDARVVITPAQLHLPYIARAAAPLAAPAAAQVPAAPGLGDIDDGALELPIIGHLSIEGAPLEARDVRVRDGRAYLVVAPFFQTLQYLRLVNVEDPTDPQVLDIANRVARDPDEVWLSGDRAYVANKTYGVEVVDISDADSLTGLGRFYWDPDGHPIAKGIHAVGDTMYIADELYGLQIVDASNPGAPVLLGSYGHGMFGEGVWVDGNTAYIAAGRPGVRLFDIAEPARPRPLQAHAIPVPGRSVDVQVTAGLLYVAAEDGGVSVYDVADPAEPLLLDTYDLFFAQKVDIVGDTLYVADDRGGLVVLDASDPTALTRIAYCDTPGRAYGVGVAEGHAFVADGTEGLQVVDLAALTPTPTPTATATNTPTPTQTPEPTIPPIQSLTIPLVYK